MRDIASDLAVWLEEDRAFTLCVVSRTWSSAPRPAGTAMAVDANGAVVGSLSGGCVEGAVYDEARAALSAGQARVAHYGVADGDAIGVGLTCGGHIDVVIVPLPVGSPDRHVVAAIVANVLADHPVTLAVGVHTGQTPPPQPRSNASIGRLLRVADRDGASADGAGPADVTGSLGSTGLDVAVTDDAHGLLHTGRTTLARYGPEGERRRDDIEILIASFAPRPRLLVYGAIDFASAVARLGAFLGYRVSVCDARPAFATCARFPDADDVVVGWPHRHFAAELQAGRLSPSTVVTVLTHDPKFDVPLLELALRSPCGYVGAMGSRRTHDTRLAGLRERGLTDVELGRLRSPIGLDLQARTPEQTALSILAEVVADEWGGTGTRLTDGAGRIHGV